MAAQPAQGHAPARHITRKVLVLMLLLSTLLVGAHLALVALSEQFVTVRGDMKPADVMIVLGGDGPSRAFKARELWHRGLAHSVIVSGDGDCDYIRDTLVEGGVPAGVVTTECLSGSTRENARFSTPLLAAAQARSAIIVTSWFHTRRAIATFAAACPSITFTAIPSEPPTTLFETAFGHYGPAIAKEYAKLALYRLQDASQDPWPDGGRPEWCEEGRE